jgi:hypothetical protein
MDTGWPRAAVAFRSSGRASAALAPPVRGARGGGPPGHARRAAT